MLTVSTKLAKASRRPFAGNSKALTGLALAAVLLSGASFVAFAQDQPVASPAPPQTQPPAPQQDPSVFNDLPSAPFSAVRTLRTQTRRVAVDVVVTDPQGRPVTNLTRADFSVSENNTPQPVRSFEVHTVGAEKPYTPPKLPPLPANTFVNLATAPESGTPTVILYDVLNTPLTDQLYAHEEIVRFLKHRKPGTQIAIFVLSDKLHLLQGFTQDTDKLTRALEQGKGKPGSSSMLAPDSGVSTVTADTPPPGGASPTAASQASNPTVLVTAEVLSDLAHMEAMDTSFLLDRRIDATLDALTEIGRFLSSLPGRKNLIWLSSSFPAGILPDSTVTVTSLGQDQSTRNYSEQIKQATDLLNISHVAVYPVDARGLAVDSTYSAARNPALNSNPSSLNKSLSDYNTKIASEHSTMESIAENTGGHAYFNTNDLQLAVDRAMNNGSTYYALTYAPTNPNFDGSLRKINVKLRVSGYTLSYRKTYFADDLNAAAQAVADSPQSPLTPSLEHGTPISHQLLVSAHLDSVGEPVPANPKQMELLSHYEAMRPGKKTKRAVGPLPPVMMQSYVIQYGLIPRQLNLAGDAPDAHRASLEFGVISYDSDGRKLNGIDTQIDENINAARYAQLKNEGYHVAQEVIIPTTAASVRLAVRDTRENSIGSLEVELPLAKPEPKPLALNSIDNKPSNQ